MNNRDIEYEQLVQKILQGMLNYDGFENLRVEHNVRLKGKSGATHQIDVFWEFKAAGSIYRTCVECKNYRSSVKKLHVAAFASILDDIGNANGIIATTESFQVGAKLLATQKNIRLVRVNNLIKTVHLTMAPKVPIYSNVDFRHNVEDVRQVLIRNNLSSFEIKQDFSGEQPLFDSEGNAVTVFNALLRKHPIKEGRNRVEVNLYYKIDGLGMVLLDAVELDIHFRDLPSMESVIESPYSAVAVLEEIVGENKHFLHDDGSVDTDGGKLR